MLPTAVCSFAINHNLFLTKDFSTRIFISTDLVFLHVININFFHLSFHEYFHIMVLIVITLNYRCDSFSDEDLQGLLIANDQCHRLDEAFERDPTRKASLPYIRQTRQDKSEYLETETSVGTFFFSN